MKKLFALLFALTMIVGLLGLTSCGSSDDNGTLIGTWRYSGSDFYVFNEGGTGTMLGMPIRWTADNGILSICNTPGTCGNICIAPADWFYEISGRNLTLDSTLIPGMSYTYRRR